MDKSYVDVIIDNKVLTLGGKEKESYYQQVASYVNEKIGELRSEPGFNRQPKDIQNILISLNIADDYLKSKARFEEVCALVDKQAKDVYKLKHDVVADKIKIEKLEKELAAAKAETSAALAAASKTAGTSAPPATKAADISAGRRTAANTDTTAGREPAAVLQQGETAKPDTDGIASIPYVLETGKAEQGTLALHTPARKSRTSRSRTNRAAESE